MSVNDISQMDKRITEFIAKMNALGLTPLVDIREDVALIAFSEKEFLGGMKRSLIKSGVPDDRLIIEVVPYGSDRYIKILVKRR